MARGFYIARIDVGDLAGPDRLEKQVVFLRKHAEVGIVGTGCIVIDEAGEKIGEERFPASDLEIRWMSLLNNPFLHPSVMFRRDVLVQHQLAYDPSFQATQDYELWTRLLEHTQAANLQECLMTYRISRASITGKQRGTQLSNHDTVALRTIRRACPDFSIAQEQVHCLREAFAGGLLPKQEREVPQVKLAGLYLDLLAAFARNHHETAGMKRLQHREVFKVIKRVMQVKYATFWLPVVTRAFHLYPTFLYPLLRRKIRRAIKRFRHRR